MGRRKLTGKAQKKHLILGPVFLKKAIITAYIHSCVVKEQRGKYGTDSWALRAPG